MKMKTSTYRLFAILLAAFVFCFDADISPAQQPVTTVRGLLERMGPDGRYYPAPRVRVTLYSDMRGRSQPAYTGMDGMYYIYNIPRGRYFLEIWIGDPNPIVYDIDVFQFPYTDIRPIRIP